jgi:biotin synthase
MKGSNKVSETSTFDCPTEFLEFSGRVEKQKNITLHLARIVGKRWEYVAGKTRGPGLDSVAERIKLGDSFGLVAYGWDRLRPSEKEELLREVRSALGFTGQGAAAEEDLGREEILAYLREDDDGPLFERADLVRRRFCGEEVHLRGIIEFSNYCGRNCFYCGLRKDHEALGRYRMSPEEILETAKGAGRLGYKTVVLQSGEDEDYPLDRLCEIVRRIKGEVDCAVTLSLGEKTLEEYRRLREAGADRYLLKFETSNRRLFSMLRPGESFENRLRCLRDLRDLGFQVGSGWMVGLPGQTDEDLAEDVLLAKRFDFDMIGIGPFIPHPGTPLRNSSGGTILRVLKLVAITRIAVKNAHMPATTATGSIDPQGRQKALRCGANVIMPNLTPQKYRRFYEIYPNKICVAERPEDCGACVRSMVLACGRGIGTGYGHSLKSKK